MAQYARFFQELCAQNIVRARYERCSPLGIERRFQKLAILFYDTTKYSGRLRNTYRQCFRPARVSHSILVCEKTTKSVNVVPC